MARSDLLLQLVKSATQGDRHLFRRTLEAMVAEERKKQHHVLAERLSEFLTQNGSPNTPALGLQRDQRVQDLIFEVMPSRGLSDLILPPAVLEPVNELIEEQRRADLLRSHGLDPRNRVLLAGPPGNGKTSLAEAVAHELALPLIVVRYEGIIGSYLGETASRLRRVFEYVNTRECVLFFDEFDTLGKERGDIHETGEIKRVVSSLLLQVDSVPPHAVVITATNHPELLDRAVWRRFQLRLFLPAPSRRTASEWFELFEARVGQSLGYAPRTLADKLPGLSFAELEDFGVTLLRQHVLCEGAVPMRKLVRKQIDHWSSRFEPAKP